MISSRLLVRRYAIQRPAGSFYALELAGTRDAKMNPAGCCGGMETLVLLSMAYQAEHHRWGLTLSEIHHAGSTPASSSGRQWRLSSTVRASDPPAVLPRRATLPEVCAGGYGHRWAIPADEIASIRRVRKPGTASSQ